MPLSSVHVVPLSVIFTGAVTLDFATAGAALAASSVSRVRAKNTMTDRTIFTGLCMSREQTIYEETPRTCRAQREGESRSVEKRSHDDRSSEGSSARDVNEMT